MRNELGEPVIPNLYVTFTLKNVPGLEVTMYKSIEVQPVHATGDCKKPR
tara:strand:- start:843 stop:989 length:147 start_codon:yes stop_codon:yes gene_type:complete